MALRNSSPPGRADLAAAAAIFLAALAPRILYVLEIDRAGLGEFLRLDPLYYHRWALRIAGGEWLGREVFEMSPLYPYSLGLLYKAFGISLTIPRILQAILGALTCTGTALLGARLFGRAAGWIAGAALAFYGPAIYYDGQINKTTLALALMIALAGALVISRGTKRLWIGAGGICLGLAALVHENVNVIAPVLLLWLLSPLVEGGWKSRIAGAGILLAGYGAIVLPVTARNVLVAGEYVLITSAGGENFYTGNNENASGRYAPPSFVRPDPFFEHEDFRQEAARRAGHPLTRREASSFWWSEGRRFVAENPGRALWLVWDKFGVFFNAFERPDNFSYYNFRKLSTVLSLPWLGFGIVAPLSFVGLILSARRWRELIPVYAATGAFLISALIFFIQSRYRMPAVPFLILFAAHGAVETGARFRERRLAAAALALALLAGAALFVNRDPGNSPGFEAQNEAILGELYYRAGRFDEAAASFRTGLERMGPVADAGNPVFARIAGAARYGLGLTELRRGEEAAAEQAFRSAATCPDPAVRGDALLELAALLEAREDREGVARVLEESVALRPGDFRLRLRHAESLHRIGRDRDAERAVLAALALQPRPRERDLADGWYGLGLVRISLGDGPGAREAFRRTLEMAPGHPRAGWIRERLAAAEGSPP